MKSENVPGDVAKWKKKVTENGNAQAADVPLHICIQTSMRGSYSLSHQVAVMGLPHF